VEKSSTEIIKKCHYQFLGGNHKAENYRGMVADLVQSYKAMWCNTSSKVHFLNSHINFFPENQWAVSDEDGAISPGYFHHGKEVPRQVQSQYAGWLLLDT
jgi:hypothetical protein